LRIVLRIFLVALSSASGRAIGSKMPSTPSAASFLTSPFSSTGTTTVVVDDFLTTAAAAGGSSEEDDSRCSATAAASFSFLSFFSFFSFLDDDDEDLCTPSASERFFSLRSFLSALVEEPIVMTSAAR
jgi:hypothetical protein